jgi:hypothetical protein
MGKGNIYKGIQTTAIHAGEAPDPATGASAPPLHMSSTFVTENVAGFSAHDIGEDSSYLYARWPIRMFPRWRRRSPRFKAPRIASAPRRAWQRPRRFS